MPASRDQPPATLRQAWDAESENWIRWARTPEHDAFFWRLGLPWLLEMLPAPGRLTLDVGCGEGRLTRILRDRGHAAVGFDPSPGLVRAAATHEQAAPVVAADAAALPVAAGAADLAVAYMSLQDIDDVESAVREAARVLGSGGRFIAAIVHPLQSAGDFGDPIVRGARQNHGRQDADFVIRDYFSPRRIADTIDRDGLRMTFHSEHRPLERYARALEAAGLLIESIREPYPDAKMLALRPVVARWTRIPWGLFVRAIRAPWAPSG